MDQCGKFPFTALPAQTGSGQNLGLGVNILAQQSLPNEERIVEREVDTLMPINTVPRR